MSELSAATGGALVSLMKGLEPGVSMKLGLPFSPAAPPSEALAEEGHSACASADQMETLRAISSSSKSVSDWPSSTRPRRSMSPAGYRQAGTREGLPGSPGAGGPAVAA